MGYQIQYVPDKRKAWAVRKNVKRGKKLGIFICIGLILLVVAIGGRPLRSWLSPGDPAVTDKAIDEMIASLRAGDGFMEAAAVFCMEVMEGDIAS